MTPQEIFNAMQSGYSIMIINKEYLKENEIEYNIFTVSCIYSDGVVTLVDEYGNIYSELNSNDINLFF